MVALLNLVGALALGSTLVNALPPLERNLAYLSPSTRLTHLGQDVANIASRIVDNHIDLVKRSTVADGLVANWTGDFGPDGAMAYKGNVTFPYGIASGDPYDTSIILWTHPVPTESNVSQPICLTYQVSTDKAGKNVVTSNYAWTTSDVGYSYKVEATGLKAYTNYYYRFAACADHSVQSETGHFRTLPSSNDVFVNSLKFAVFSCSNYPFGFFNSYASAALKDLDVWLHVGDFIYEYAGDGSADSYGDGRNISRVPEPNQEIVTLEDYRTRYATYKKDEGLRALSAAHALFAVPDDHEVADNTWKGGSADSNNTAAGTVLGVTFTDRKRNAVQAYHEWMPIRQVDTTDSLRFWRRFQFGRLASFSMLDTRQYERDITDLYYNTDVVAAMSNDTNRSLMGGKQEQWLYNNLANDQKSGIQWKIVGQQIILAVTHEGAMGDSYDYDAWDGYNANRRRLFKTIRDNNVQNTIFLSGDSHAAWSSDLLEAELLNSTAYDPVTGKGSIAVEFAGTGVTSPPSYGQGKTSAQYVDRAKLYTQVNRGLQFAEGELRGYFTVEINPFQATAKFWGTPDILTQNTNETLIVQLDVKAGQNHLSRPLNGGKNVTYGALQSKVVKYNTTSANRGWNGTAYQL
ncbi:hypothetical protein CF327_g4592 [Tilletia walkeri]|uniref:Alkaline phosphatase n=1 Tax=Tilletia walkeri TaxID=117179 RepID=A0A8X7T6M4_9BASI|nr:hypothetical protein CF327_g4592 [Tilletia walkeri]KAE8269463.1 hypothetical protein A4X09_0g2892 [Tilletia walkeri]